MVFRRLLIFFSVFIGQVVVDQWTKHLATEHLKHTPTKSWLSDTFRLQYATNEGAFLSLGANLPPAARYWVLTIGVGLLLFMLCIYALFSERLWKTKLDDMQVGAYSLIASGGFSNWVDRARFEGSVVDFMNMGIGSLRTGVFNVADLAIVAGIVLLFIQGWREEKKQKRAQALNETSNPQL